MITQRHEQTLCRPDYTVGATVYASVYKCTSRYTEGRYFSNATA